MRKKTLNVKKAAKLTKIKVWIGSIKALVIINKMESFEKYKRQYSDAVIVPNTESITG